MAPYALLIFLTLHNTSHYLTMTFPFATMAQCQATLAAMEVDNHSYGDAKYDSVCVERVK
jgi:hypothetical protein